MNSGKRTTGLSIKLSAAWALAAIAGSAGLPAQAAPHEPASIPRTLTEWRDDCLMYTTLGIDIIGPFEVFGDPNPAGSPRLPFRSDVCTTGVAEIGESGMKTEIPVGAPELLDVAVIAPTLNLNRASETSDCVFDSANAGGLTVSPEASVVCPVQQDVDLSTMPDFAELSAVLPFPVFNAGTEDDIVAAGDTKTLLPEDDNPDQYRNILLGSTARLVFPKPGNYRFESLQSEIRADKVFLDVQAAGVNIMVKGCMYLGHRSRVNEDDYRLFKVFVEGVDADCPERTGETQPPTAFTYDGDGRFNACYVYSPNGTQTWRGIPKVTRTYKTQIFATDFTMRGRRTRVSLSHPEDIDCFEQVIPDLMCEAKTLTPEVITTENATVQAAVSIRNNGTTAFTGLIVRDTMDTELSFAGSAEFNGTGTNASGGPPTWTFDPLNVPVGQSTLSYDIAVTGLADDESACNTVGLFDGQGNLLSQCDACVTRNALPAVADCDEKIITPNVIATQDGQLDVEVYISNPSATRADPVVITDTMNTKMTYVAGSAKVGGVAIADPVQGPPNVYTFPDQALDPLDSLVLTYKVDVSGLANGEVISNDVSVSTGVVRAAIAGKSCDATVTRFVSSDTHVGACARIVWSVFADCVVGHRWRSAG